jgi:hypothetical protein
MFRKQQDQVSNDGQKRSQGVPKNERVVWRRLAKEDPVIWRELHQSAHRLQRDPKGIQVRPNYQEHTNSSNSEARIWVTTTRD